VGLYQQAIRMQPAFNDNRKTVGPFHGRLAAHALPVVVVTLVYGLGLAYGLARFGLESHLMRLCALVLVGVVPVIAFHALLSSISIQLSVLPHAIAVRTLGSEQGIRMITLAHVTDVRLRPGLTGWLTRSASLDVILGSGERVTVSGLAKPEQSRDAVLAAMAAHREAKAASGRAVFSTGPQQARRIGGDA
jgi:hypothetical protein